MSEWTKRHERELTQLESELTPVMRTVMVSTPRHEETKALLKSLVPALEEADAARDQVWQQHNWRSQPSLWRQMKTQAKLYGWPFWIASFVGFALITLAMRYQVKLPSAGEVSPFFQFAPLVLLASLLYGYRTWNRGMRMVESVTVFPPALIVLSRFLVVLALDIVLTLGSTVYLLLSAASKGQPVNPLLFTLYALAPLTFLFGVTAYTMLYKGIKTGMAIGFVLWALGLVTSLTDVLMTPAIMAVALGLGIGLTTLAYRRGRTVHRLELG